MVSPNNNAKRNNIFDVSKSPLRKRNDDYKSNENRSNMNTPVISKKTSSN